MKQFPIITLHERINEVLGKIISIDILQNIKSGVDSQVNIIDEEGKLTDIASIAQYYLVNDPTPRWRVRVSAAFAQGLWLMCEAVLWTHDYTIVKSGFSQFSDQQLSMLHAFSQSYRNSELSYVISLLSDEKVDVARNFELINTIFSRKVTAEEIEELYTHNKDSQFGTYVNAMYVYAMSFILLHELSHHDLGQDFTVNTLDDEINADESAFWALYSDLTEKEHTTAMHGVVCALSSFLFIDDPLGEDPTHPKPFERIFRYYHIALKENYKEKNFLRTILFYWACYMLDEKLIEMVCDINKSMDEIEQYLYNLEDTQIEQA